uniref:Sushi domain-containing protein n=1 Tax=Acrobeloides nanus TaxID=290746 RepID=A0A914EQH0_9BILA
MRFPHELAMFYIHMYYLIEVFLLLLHIIYAYECDHFRDIQGGKIFYDEYNEIGLKVGTTAKLICGNGDVTTALCTEEGWEPR